MYKLYTNFLLYINISVYKKSGNKSFSDNSNKVIYLSNIKNMI